MAKPGLIAVDDDPQVLAAVERDLIARYGGEYRVLRAESGKLVLDLIDQIAQRGDAVALILADQRMPGMSGVELLTKLRKLSPLSRRVLLTAYADTDAAIQAINDARLDYYLTKPYDDPANSIYPVIDDLLEIWKSEYAQWSADRTPDYKGIKVIGHRWSPASHDVKDLLARNQVPYKWLDIDRDAEAKEFLSSIEPRIPCFPVVIFPDGAVLEEPTPEQVSAKAGLNTRASHPFYDLVIVGGGPTGLAAAVYGASEGLSTLLIELHAPGGQAGTSSRIENYLGFPSGLSGADLARRAVTQARRFGVEILAPQYAKALHVRDNYRHIVLGNDTEVTCHAVLVATGVSYRKLEIEGADRFEGAGIYYGAAMTEALSCRDEDVFVIGGANSAGQGAMYLSQFARKVTILVRANSLEKSMSAYLIDQIKLTANIEVRTNTVLCAAHGTDYITEVEIDNTLTHDRSTCPAASVFVFIGAEPRTEWLDDQVRRDEHGFILTGPDLYTAVGKRPDGWPLQRDPYLLETSLPGVFAAGDVRHGAMRRVAAGVGTGSMSVQLIHQYLADVK
jgi:thioredoxin reductase (NADPH)